MNTKLKEESRQSQIPLRYLESLLRLKRAKLYELVNTAGRFYKPYDIHKVGTSKWRHIDNPQDKLKIIQERIHKKILRKKVSLLPDGMTGGISGKSIVDNAKLHIGKESIGIIDIKDCFPHTNDLMIYEVWRTYFGCGLKTAQILTKLTTFQHRLPQGAPTSSLLCNFALIPVFEEINNYAIDHELDLTIFVDDITISGKKNYVIEAINPIISILKRNKYSVRKRKLKIITSNYKQKVTAITVNKKLSINRKEIQLIRELILETALLKDYIPSYKLHQIKGKINFTTQVSEAQGKKLEKFAEKHLILPTMHVVMERSDEKRSCNKFKKDHQYIAKS